MASNDGKRLYEYHVLDRSGENTVTVVEPTTVLASSESVARNLAVRAVPEAAAEHLEKLEIVVRAL